MGYGAGGGAFTALFGLFAVAIQFCLRIVLYIVGIAGVIVLLAVQGFCELYRRHQEKKGITPKDTQKLPEPYMSPVEYHGHGRS